jgi:LSD1 subclass zinc finger protein
MFYSIAFRPVGTESQTDQPTLLCCRFGFSPSPSSSRARTEIRHSTPFPCPLQTLTGMAGGSSSPSPPPAPVQVLCAGCRGILAVAPGMTEFICPKCQMAQRLPPQLMPKPPSSSTPSPPTSSAASAPAPPQHRKRSSQPQPQPQPQAHGVDPTKIQLPCVRCQAVLNVPHGLANFRCPQCGVDLAVDVSKLQEFLAATSNSNGAPQASGATPPSSSAPTPLLPQPPPLVAVMANPMVLATAEPPEEINEVC